jgi:hypothetical protein
VGTEVQQDAQAKAMPAMRHLPMAATIMTDHTEIIAAANARADADVAQGIRDLEQSVATSPEYKVGSDPSGKRLLSPARAMLVGMLGHLRTSYARHHERSDAA